MMQWLPICQHPAYDELKYICYKSYLYNDGLAQDWSNSISNALELPQSCSKPSIYFTCKVFPFIPLVIFLGLLPSNHIENIYQTYNGNSLHWCLKKMVEITQMVFWQMQIF